MSIETLGTIISILMTILVAVIGWLVNRIDKLVKRMNEIDTNLTKINATMKLEKEIFSGFRESIERTLSNHGEKLGESRDKYFEISKRLAIIEQLRGE